MRMRRADFTDPGLGGNNDCCNDARPRRKARLSDRAPSVHVPQLPRLRDRLFRRLELARLVQKHNVGLPLPLNIEPFAPIRVLRRLGEGAEGVGDGGEEVLFGHGMLI